MARCLHGAAQVAEHIPPSLHAALADFLVRHTGGFLVFSAGRPGQRGVGHIGNRPRAEWQAEFTQRGLLYLPNTTNRLRFAARNGEFRKNVQVSNAECVP